MKETFLILLVGGDISKLKVYIIKLFLNLIMGRSRNNGRRDSSDNKANTASAGRFNKGGKSGRGRSRSRPRYSSGGLSGDGTGGRRNSNDGGKNNNRPGRNNSRIRSRSRGRNRKNEEKTKGALTSEDLDAAMDEYWMKSGNKEMVGKKLDEEMDAYWKKKNDKAAEDSNINADDMKETT